MGLIKIETAPNKPTDEEVVREVAMKWIGCKEM